MSLAGPTSQYYANTFCDFIMPRICYSYFDIVNDKSDRFAYWPEALKMDHFLERCWKMNYEDDAVQKFVYNLA